MFTHRLSFIFSLTILIFSLFFQTTPALAQSATESSIIATSSSTIATSSSTIATSSAETEKKSWLQSMLDWFSGLFLGVFVKEYEIDLNTQDSLKKQQFTDYGEKDDGNPYGIGNRAVNDVSQFCLKGEVIKKVILDKEPDKPLAKACFSSQNNSCQSLEDPLPTGSTCQDITINTLAYYFLQNNQQFYCNDQNQKISIEPDISQLIVQQNTNTQLIPNSDCYQKIYQQFYITLPQPDNAATDINTNRILSQPIPAQNQPNIDVNDETQVGADNQSKKRLIDQMMSPESEDRKNLNNLVPQPWQ